MTDAFDAQPAAPEPSPEDEAVADFEPPKVKPTVTLPVDEYEKMQLALARGRRLALDAMNNDQGVFWRRSRRMRELRGDVIERYRTIHGGELIERPAFYYGTAIAKFGVEVISSGAELAAIAVLQPSLHRSGDSPVASSIFNLSVGDTSMTRWIEGPHLLTAADTNLLNPGETIFAEELFFVEAIAARFRGIRVRYSDADVVRMGLQSGSSARLLVTGAADVWGAGDIVPAAFRDELRRAANAMTVHFTWRDVGIGGSNTTTDAMVASFAEVPGALRDVPATSVRDALALPQGYVWTTEKGWQITRDQGGSGLFDCELQADGPPVVVPFKPSPVFGIPPKLIEMPKPGASKPSARPPTYRTRKPVAKTDTPPEMVPSGVPTGFALVWEVCVHGTALLPGRCAYRPLEPRRKIG